ncbi:MAG TPA: acyloxyacyl hydrolase [Acidobacteriaceae bacterium]|nr:acyloxyacyl hydrolase [Acidobacteriaceae bacterium]
MSAKIGIAATATVATRTAVTLWLCLGVACAQQNISAASGIRPAVRTRGALDLGVLAQGGMGVTDNRADFRFFMVGVHMGKVLTGDFGPGPIRGNFEYAAELFPFWQSRTPTANRQNCVTVTSQLFPGVQQASCSVPFSIGGTYTGVSLTPAILRWNFDGGHRWTPWIQGAGGLLWTNHKYPPFGGPPISSGGLSLSTLGNNGPNADTSVWNFTPQFGVGVHYFIRPTRSIDFGANAVHISSASLGDKNPGVNASVQFNLGYTWWK